MLLKLRKISLFSAFLLLIGNSLLAQIVVGDEKEEALKKTGGSIQTPVPFLLISPDARAGAMGDAGVASSPDINSQHWNAAKYPFIGDESGFSLTYSPWLRVLVPDMNLLYLSGYYRLDENSVFASSLRFFSLGTVQFRNSADENPQAYHPNEYAFDLSYSRKLSENFSIAVAGRYIRSDLTNGFVGYGASKSSAANSGSADISMYYTQDLMTTKAEGSSLAIGLNISNIGAKVSYSDALTKDFLPANLRLGASYTVQMDRYNQLTGMIDFVKLLVPTPPYRVNDTIVAGKDPNVGVVQGVFQSFSDAPSGFGEELQEINISVGVEYLYNKAFAFRGGYFYEHANKGGRKYFTFGAGIKLNVFEVDFSYLLPTSLNANNPLKNTLRFTLKFNFAEYMRKQKQTNAD